MEILSHLVDGVFIALEPLNIILMLVGVALGLFIGAMPGLGSVNGVAILLPATFLVPPASAMIFLAAIYYGARYAWAISSITLGIPGASTAVATTFDGRPLALKGRADLALVTAAALASLFEPLWNGRNEILLAALWLVALGSGVTALRRSWRIVGKLRGA